MKPLFLRGAPVIGGKMTLPCCQSFWPKGFLKLQDFGLLGFSSFLSMVFLLDSCLIRICIYIYIQHIHTMFIESVYYVYNISIYILCLYVTTLCIYPYVCNLHIYEPIQSLRSGFWWSRQVYGESIMPSISCNCQPPT